MIPVYLAVCTSQELRNKMYDTLIVAIGSKVMTDDAVGYHILQLLQKDNITADFVELGMDLFRLRLFFKNHKRVIILDALKGDYPPGTVLSFKYQDFQSNLDAKIRSIHHIGSIEAIEIMRNADEKLANAEIHFVGIIVDVIDKGLELTNCVAQALPEAARTVKSLLK